LSRLIKTIGKKKRGKGGEKEKKREGASVKLSGPAALAPEGERKKKEGKHGHNGLDQARFLSPMRKKGKGEKSGKEMEGPTPPEAEPEIFQPIPTEEEKEKGKELQRRTALEVPPGPTPLKAQFGSHECSEKRGGGGEGRVAAPGVAMNSSKAVLKEKKDPLGITFFNSCRGEKKRKGGEQKEGPGPSPPSMNNKGEGGRRTKQERNLGAPVPV